MKYINKRFYGCDSLHQIQIPASVEEIAKKCFENHKLLEIVTFSSNSVLRSIGKKAFYYCEKLREIRGVL